MPNLGKLVAGHNTKATTPANNYGEPNCNCRGKNAVCMIEGSRCMDEGVVYQAEVTANNKLFDDLFILLESSAKLLLVFV